MYEYKRFRFTVLKSKTILVTGASRGIGKALAEKLLDLGNIVIGTSRNLNSLENLAEKLLSFYQWNLILNPQKLSLI